MKHALESRAAQAEQSQRDQRVSPQSPELVTQKAICQRLGISDETWRRWRQSGRAPAPAPWPLSSHRMPRWRRAVIDAFVASRGEGRSYFKTAR